MSILVRAIKEGYYGRRRRPGRPEEETFRIPSREQLGSWMVVISEDDLPVDTEIVIDAESESKPEPGDDAPEPTEPLDVPENTAEQEGEDAMRGDTLDKQIIQVLSGLDHDDDSLWTDGGLVRMSVVEGALGDDGITRGDVKNAWPGFERHSQ